MTISESWQDHGEWEGLGRNGPASIPLPALSHPPATVPQWFPTHALSVPFSFLSLEKVGRISGPSCMSAMRTRSQLHEAALRPESSMFRMQEESTQRDQHIHLFLWQAWNGTASGKWYEINQFLCLEETNGAPCHLRVHGAPTWCQSHSRRPHAPTALQVAPLSRPPQLPASLGRSICETDTHAHGHFLFLVWGPQENTLEERWCCWSLPLSNEPAHPRADKTHTRSHSTHRASFPTPDYSVPAVIFPGKELK